MTREPEDNQRKYQESNRRRMTRPQQPHPQNEFYWLTKAQLDDLLLDLEYQRYNLARRTEEAIRSQKYVPHSSAPAREPPTFQKLSHPYIHHKKCWTHYFEKVISGEKPWEKRIWDTDYQTGDTLILEEWNPGLGYSGRSAGFVIGYILDGEFAKPGECLMTLKTVCGRESCKGCPKEYRGCTEQGEQPPAPATAADALLDELETWCDEDKPLTDVMITRSNTWWYRRFKDQIAALRQWGRE